MSYSHDSRYSIVSKDAFIMFFAIGMAVCRAVYGAQSCIILHEKNGATYPETIRALAKRYDIEIREEEESKEEKEIRLKKERLIPNTIKKYKYLNSCDSIIYNKLDYVYGLDTAKVSGKQKQLLYLVEVAGDALKMQSVGIENTVAALGGEWSDTMFSQVKRLLHRCRKAQ